MGYHPSVGRWIERDPVPYPDGMNMYQYVQSTPVSATDPTGRWTEVERNGGARARVCSDNSGDTWLSLAQKVKHDEDEYQLWVKNENGGSPPSKPEQGMWYSVPNKVIVDYGSY
jgi:hypothetical protein